MSFARVAIGLHSHSDRPCNGFDAHTPGVDEAILCLEDVASCACMFSQLSLYVSRMVSGISHDSNGALHPSVLLSIIRGLDSNMMAVC